MFRTSCVGGILVPTPKLSNREHQMLYLEYPTLESPPVKPPPPVLISESISDPIILRRRPIVHNRLELEALIKGIVSWVFYSMPINN